MGETYIYAFIRQDLSPEDQMVQLGHACLEAGHAFYRPATGLKRDVMGLEGEPDVANLIVFGVADFIELERARMKMQAHDVRHHYFFEPDRKGPNGAIMGWTAFATEPISGDRRKIFKNYRLWKASVV